MKYKIKHITRYFYESDVVYSHNQSHLIPRNTPYQNCLTHEFEINPHPDDRATRIDVFGNLVAYFSLQIPHREFTVSSSSVVDVAEPDEPDTEFSGLTLENVQALMQQQADPETRLAADFVLDSPFVKRTGDLYNYASPVLRPEQPLLVAVNELMRKIFTEFEFDPGFTDTATPLESVLLHKRGVCQDFAHLAIACLRSHGLAARYVSGYLETEPPPGQPKLVGADASHAWFAVYLPGAGWLGFDPTNNIVPMGRHITLAWGRDYTDVTPLKGVIYGGGRHSINVSVDVSAVQD
ncbi:MAG: transglutaminase family protein [Gammaproteobacteria bacterium]|nr:transglutaminase family protein [Gammaproteobacteria bacterium]